MFRGYEVLTRVAFRVTRNSNLYMQEEESRSVLESVRSELHNRRKGDAVRLEIESQRSGRDCRAAANELRARPLAGIQDRWAGKSFAADESLLRGQATGSEVSPICRQGVQAQREVHGHLR